MSGKNKTLTNHLAFRRHSINSSYYYDYDVMKRRFLTVLGAEMQSSAFSQKLLSKELGLETAVKDLPKHYKLEKLKQLNTDQVRAQLEVCGASLFLDVSLVSKICTPDQCGHRPEWILGITVMPIRFPLV